MSKWGWGVGLVKSRYTRSVLVVRLHIWGSQQVGIGSDYGLSPVRPKTITSNNPDFLSIARIGTIFSETRLKIKNFSFMKMNWKISAKWWTICSERNVLTSFPSFTGTCDYHEITSLMSLTKLNARFHSCTIPHWNKFVALFINTDAFSLCTYILYIIQSYLCILVRGY